MESNINKTLPEFSGSFDKRLPLRESRASKGLRGLTDNFAIVGAILQQPAQFFDEIRDGINLSEKIWALFVSSTVFLAFYGAVLGSGHPLLSLNAAISVPLLFLGSLITCVPVMYLLDVLSGSQRSLSQMVAILLTPTCAASTVLFSFAPIMVVFKLTGTLPQFLWLNIGILAMATLVGLIYVTQGLIQTAIVDTSHALSKINRRLHFLWMLLFLMVISQMAWGLLNFFQKTGGPLVELLI
ncbi:hypothetical protein ACFLXQ_08305 [Chloroflexota bacterium]